MDPIRWKNLVARVEGVLSEQGLRAPEIADLLTPAWELRDDYYAWRYMSDGLARFLRPGWYRMFRVPVGVPEVATIGERFVVGPLLRIVTGDGHFLLLALSQRRVRLLEGGLQRVEELELADVPTSLRDVVEPPEPRPAGHRLPRRPRSGPVPPSSTAARTTTSRRTRCADSCGGSPTGWVTT